jgi:hypothetical protein
LLTLADVQLISLPGPFGLENWRRSASATNQPAKVFFFGRQKVGGTIPFQGEDMATSDVRINSSRDQTQRRSPTRQRRDPKEIVEGVRRQREHIMMLDGSDPLRGGVAD